MGKIWVLTGPPGIGKSTIVSKLILRLKSLGVIVGGCATFERRAKGTRVGFELRDLSTGMTGELASISGRLGPKVGKYRVNLVDLSKIGAAGLSRAAASSELIVIDELGPMELVGPEFRRSVRECIDSGKPIVAVVHERLEDDLINEVKEKAARVIVLSLENRGNVVAELTDELAAALSLPRVT